MSDSLPDQSASTGDAFAVHVTARVLDQVRFNEPPSVIVGALAVNVTVGAGGGPTTGVHAILNVVTPLAAKGCELPDG